MPLDAFCLTAVKNELAARIVGLRVDKIQQPERDELILSLRGQGDAMKLLISAGTGDARIHETHYSYENPASPPMFCMLLRKHLTGARILRVTQPPLERQLDLTVTAADQLGDVTEKHLILELMGRYSNVILTDAEGLIIDCLRRVDAEMSQRRQVLPGLFYRLPPAQDKADPLAVSEEAFDTLVCRPDVEKTADSRLIAAFSGISPLIAREIAARAYGETDLTALPDGGALLRSAFMTLMEEIRAERFTPCLLVDGEGRPRDFSYTEITQYGDLYRRETPGSFSELLESFYSRRAGAERVRQRSADMTKTVKNALERVRRKLMNQRTELLATEKREEYRQRGDLITANLWNMQKGQRVLRTENFYDPAGGVCEIPLDPLKTPQQNAAKYYKDYTKARNAEKYLTEQIALAEREEEYLSSVLDEISRAEGESDLSEIRQELTDSGYIRQQKNAPKKKRAPARPMRFISSTGMEIRVGKNNAQNDELTLHQAFKNDMWLHAQKIHGSHVIISTGGGDPDETTLREAASLAAYYSQGRGSGRVAVDYTRARYVKKPGGARPGMVIYTDYKTIQARPDEALAEKLRSKS